MERRFRSLRNAWEEGLRIGYNTSHEVSHMSQEASTSPHHLNHMRDYALLEENAPPFSGELSYTSERRLEMLFRLINSLENTLNQLSTLETSPR